MQLQIAFFLSSLIFHKRFWDALSCLRGMSIASTVCTTVQSRGFFTSPLTPADNFTKPPADPRTCPLSIPPRDTLIPPRIRRGPAVVPPDTSLIPPRIRGGLTISNDDVIMIDSWDKIDLVIFLHVHVCKRQQRRSACTIVQSDHRHRDICLNAYFHFYIRSC